MRVHMIDEEAEDSFEVQSIKAGDLVNPSAAMGWPGDYRQDIGIAVGVERGWFDSSSSHSEKNLFVLVMWNDGAIEWYERRYLEICEPVDKEEEKNDEFK